MKRFVLMLLALLCLAGAAQADIFWCDADQVHVKAVDIHDEKWLFLPSGADLHALRLHAEEDDLLLDWLAQSAENPDLPHVHSGTLPDGTPLNVMVSTLRSLHLYSIDMENFGREWLEDCDLHEKSTSADLVVLGKDGKRQHFIPVDELRGRGNSTWQKARFKRPFQMKLAYKADLMNTGIPSERGRSWALLSNEQDDTMLRNQIALDLGRELGLSETSRCEPVDLYYDSDYRGVYLLCERVDVGEHCVDVRDFDKLLEPINDMIGAPDPDDLPSPTKLGTQPPVPYAYNDYGLPYGCPEGTYDNPSVDAGGYLLQLEAYGTMSEQAWFQLPTGRYVSFKSPEAAGPTMVKYVSELFMAMYDTMMNHGFHPESGVPLEDFLDLESYVRSHLVQELMLNSTSYSWSSTFFVLPEGQRRFRAGPVWDFDRCESQNWPGLKNNNVFSRAFYRTTALQKIAQKICREEVKPLVENVLFGNKHGQHLKPLSAYREELRVPWMMNYCRFFAQTQGFLHIPATYDGVMDQSDEFFRYQTAFVLDEVEKWQGDKATAEIDLQFLLPCGNPMETEYTYIVNEQHGSLILDDVRFECVSYPTEEEFGEWEVTFTIRPRPHAERADEVLVWVNGDAYPCRFDENGQITLTFAYTDWYYRPAILDGVDFGLVFDHDYYVDSNPDLYEEDRETVLRHFRDEGMPAGAMGNEFFDPIQIYDSFPDQGARYGADWPVYYDLFMRSPGRWMADLDNTYQPDLELVTAE